MKTSDNHDLSHQPKGRMCVTCQHWSRGCTHLDFTKMPKIGMNGPNITIVKCVDFKKELEN